MKITNILIMGALIFSLVACENKAETEDTTTTTKDKPTTIREIKSYGIGKFLADHVRQDSGRIDYEYLVMGLKDAVDHKEPRVSENEIMQAFQKDDEVKFKAENNISDEDIQANRAAGEKFLAENKNKAGVKVTESGMQYEILKSGTGNIPQSKDRVHFQLKAYSIDGRELDNTYGLPDPPRAHVAGVFPGFKEAFMMMQEGSIWKLYLNADLIRGDMGIPDRFGPGETVIFELELLNIIPEGSPTDR
jgi:FKBP-type peptidyl-prolyl cis-trans isomerase